MGPTRAWKRRILLGMGLVFLAATAGIGRWMFVTATQDLVSFLRQAPPCRIEWMRTRSVHAGEFIDLRLFDAEGAVDATLRLPPGKEPCAAVIILGGLRTGRDAVNLVDPQLPYAVAALDYARDTSKPITGVRWLTELPALIRDFKRTGVALRDLQRAVAAHERVDPSRVYLLGASLGAPLASAVTAAIRPAGLALLYGFADHEAMFSHRLQPYVGWRPLRALLASLAGWLSGAFDAAETLPQACGTPILMVGSAEDEDLPTRCSQALWYAACEPKRRVELPGGHIDAGRKQEVLRAATQAVRDWLETEPSASVGGPTQGASACASS